MNMKDEIEIVRYNLSKDTSATTVMILAEVYQHNGEWTFQANGQDFEDGLEATLCYDGFHF